MKPTGVYPANIQNPTICIELLRNFIERVNRLNSSSYIRAIRTNPLKLTIKGDIAKGQLSLINTHVDLEHLESFLLNLRLFHQEEDSISLNRMPKFINSLAVDSALKEEFIRQRNKLKKFLSSPSNILFNKDPLTNREIFETILYGYRAHLKIGKPFYQRYKEWASDPFASNIIGFAFNNVLVTYFEALFTMARILVVMLAELVLASEPQDAEAWNTKGITLCRLGRYPEALQAFDKAIEINPDFIEVLENKGVAQARLGNNHEALLAFDRAIELRPGYSEAWTNKGNVLDELGRYQEALQAFENALSLGPNNSEAWFNKGITLARLGLELEALRAFKMTIELRPDNSEAWYYKSRIHSLSRDKNGAIASLRKAIEFAAGNQLRAKADDGFTWLWEDDDFKKFTAT